MSYQHKNLAKGAWSNLSFVEQMANIGSEVNRAILWKNKKNRKMSEKALFRALELIDLTKEEASYSRLKEICRMRELLIDYLMYDNEYQQNDEQWEKYFLAFGWAARL